MSEGGCCDDQPVSLGALKKALRASGMLPTAGCPCSEDAEMCGSCAWKATRLHNALAQGDPDMPEAKPAPPAKADFTHPGSGLGGCCVLTPCGAPLRYSVIGQTRCEEGHITLEPRVFVREATDGEQRATLERTARSYAMEIDAKDARTEAGRVEAEAAAKWIDEARAELRQGPAGSKASFLWGSHPNTDYLRTLREPRTDTPAREDNWIGYAVRALGELRARGIPDDKPYPLHAGRAGWHGELGGTASLGEQVDGLSDIYHGQECPKWRVCVEGILARMADRLEAKGE